MNNQEIKVLKVDLEDKDNIVTNHSHFVAHQYRKQEFQELDEKVSEMLSKIDISIEELLKAERLRTLKWLSDTSLADKQQQLRSKVDKVNKKSGKWLLESINILIGLQNPIHSFGFMVLRVVGSLVCAPPWSRA